MIPLVDMHCHLLSGLDDGPRTEEDALTMCRMAWADGVHIAAAGAHQNERWQNAAPERIRQAAQDLARRLRDAEIPLAVFPCAEVAAHPDIRAAWDKGEILSVADRRQYLLIEMPHGVLVDLEELTGELASAGIRPILAHPERQPGLLHDVDRIEQLIRVGCLVQVSASSITSPSSRRDERALRDWCKRGIIHLLGSDGHSPNRRPPKMADAYRQVVRWAGRKTADRIGSTNGMAISQGMALRIPELQVRSKHWLFPFW